MLLTIDVGNTNTMLGIFDDDQIVEHWRIATDPARTADEIAVVLQGLLGHSSLVKDPDISGIALCSTVPSVLHEMREMCRRYYGDIPSLIVEPGVRTGVSVRMDNPKEVGSDRIMNTVAAVHLYGGPAVVVDFGTSTNFDAVSPRGEFVGGALAPGIEISVDALTRRAAQLLKVELARPQHVIGKNTVEALQSGIIFGFAGQVEGVARRMAAELAPEDPESVTIIATGGLAPLVIDEVSIIDAHEPWLTLIGLRLVFERNNVSSWAGAAGALQVGPVRLGEPEPLVQAVGVRGVQGPPERGARALLDHHVDQRHAQALAAEVLVDVDVGQVGETGAVRHGPGKADHGAGAPLVHTDHPPGAVQLLLDDRPGPPPAPVRLLGQELPQPVPVHPGRVVVELEFPCRGLHGLDCIGRVPGRGPSYPASRPGRWRPGGRSAVAFTGWRMSRPQAATRSTRPWPGTRIPSRCGSGWTSGSGCWTRAWTRTRPGSRARPRSPRCAPNTRTWRRTPSPAPGWASPAG